MQNGAKLTVPKWRARAVNGSRYMTGMAAGLRALQLAVIPSAEKIIRKFQLTFKKQLLMQTSA